METTLILLNEAQTQAIGSALAPLLLPPLTCFFKGELGAGKTSLIRAILRAKGIIGAIKSPSYTLIEPYEIAHQVIYHMDLYRLEDEDQLEWLGIRDYFHQNALCLIEWPERAVKGLPKADVICELTYYDEGRAITLSADTDVGEKIIKTFHEGRSK